MALPLLPVLDFVMVIFTFKVKYYEDISPSLKQVIRTDLFMILLLNTSCQTEKQQISVKNNVTDPVLSYESNIQPTAQYALTWKKVDNSGYNNHKLINQKRSLKFITKMLLTESIQKDVTKSLIQYITK